MIEFVFEEEYTVLESGPEPGLGVGEGEEPDLFPWSISVEPYTFPLYNLLLFLQSGIV